MLLPTRKRSPLKLLAIVVGSMVSLYVLLVLIGAIGWDGY